MDAEPPAVLCGQKSTTASSSLTRGNRSTSSEDSTEAPALVVMDADPAIPPGQRSTLTSSSRKRGTWSSTSEDTEIYSVTGDDSSDDSFVSVRSRKAKRRLIKTSSPGSTSTLHAKPERWPHTILFIPVDNSISLRGLNRQALSVFFEGMAPNEIKEVRINTRKNVLAVDTTRRNARDKLRQITELGNIKVRPVIPMEETCTAGVIYDIDLAITNSDLPILIKPAYEGVAITHVCRLGNSRCVKIVFKGDSIPSHVKVGHFRHVVRPFVPKPLQCHKCFKIGHVEGACAKSVVCPRCAESHTADVCRATNIRCGNCNGSHEATSKDCPRIKKEFAILKQMVRDSSSHSEASEKIRRRRRRHRRKRTTQGAVHAQIVPTRSASSTSRPEITRRPQTENPSRVEDWPALPSAQPSKETTRLMPPSKQPSVDVLPTVDRQIIPMLRSIIDVIRVMLTSMETPSARRGLQVLDSLSPVLATLE